ASGLDVAPGSTVLFARALAAVGMQERDRIYWAGRATLVSRPEDIEDYERCFEALFVPDAGLRGLDGVEVTREIVIAYDTPGGEAPAHPAAPLDAETPVLQVRYSPAEVLRHRDFATYSPAEHAEARQLMADLRFVGGLRRSRRSRRSRRTRGRPELRRTVRQSLRTGGEPIRRAFTEKSERPRRLVFLCDVSGSMEPYARALVRFLHTVVIARGRVEVFALGTRMTRITRELSSRDPDAALASAARRVVDWSGGTRLGEGLRAFNDEWGIRGMARGATVVVISDGWERGDADELAEQMARLHRVAHKIVWVNPLKATPGYAPLAAGMAAALPYIDEFVEGHSLASLEALAAVLA
ncbi:MAG: vWA domain-containing protein, partial [Acidimicrobiia bacterium]